VGGGACIDDNTGSGGGGKGASKNNNAGSSWGGLNASNFYLKPPDSVVSLYLTEFLHDMRQPNSI
jgi:hypothetical protein